jgi:hypothetical protein
VSLTNKSYAKSPQFAAPRSYWRGVLIGYGPAATVTLVDNVIHVHESIGGLDYIDTYITLDPRFVPWSSNNWTLDHVFIDEYSQINGGPHLFFHAILDYGLMTPSPKFGAGFTYDGSTAAYNVWLPPAPTGYWLPELP